MRWLPSRLQRLFERPTGGQMLVDFALKMPLMVLVVAGSVDFSVAVGRSAQLTSAVQEGATYGRRAWTDTSGIRQHVKKEASTLNISDGDITITCFEGLTTTVKNCNAAWMSDSIRVRATYNYHPITGRLLSITGDPLFVTQSVTMQIY